VSRSNPPRRRGPGSEEPPSSCPPDGRREVAATLATLVDSASRIVDDLASNGVFDRLQRVFQRMPATDRPTILEVLEREVEYRCLTQGTADLATGYETRANPNARLYLRILTDPQPPPLMDREELVRANHRGLRVLRYVLGPLHGVWLDSLAEAVALLSDDERAAARQVLAETLALLDSPGPPPSR
jgi:hypothetical protein